MSHIFQNELDVIRLEKKYNRTIIPEAIKSVK